MRLIKANTITGLRRIIDFSSDSARNFSGVGIVDARAGLLATNITVNGLPILNDSTENPLAHICTDQVIGGPDEYVDISKDGSGIYAKGGNRGYLIWKRTSDDETVFGAEPVRGSQKLVDAKKWLLKREGVTLHDEKLWRSGMLLRLPKDTPSGKKLVPAGHYYFGSISNGAYATLKPLVGGDIYDGIKVSTLLANGLQRVD